MFRALIILGTVGTIVWSFFDPLWASTVFLLSIAGFEGFIFMISRTGHPDHLKPFSEPLYLNPDEIVVLKKYHLFFRFPFVSPELSAGISAIQLSTIIWVPWLLYHGLWVTSIAIGINYFISGPLAMQLNPRPFLSHATGAVELCARVELMAIESVIQKLKSRLLEK